MYDSCIEFDASRDIISNPIGAFLSTLVAKVYPANPAYAPVNAGYRVEFTVKGLLPSILSPTAHELVVEDMAVVMVPIDEPFL